MPQGKRTLDLDNVSSPTFHHAPRTMTRRYFKLNAQFLAMNSHPAAIHLLASDTPLLCKFLRCTIAVAA